MKKVDFTKIMIVDVEGHEVAADIAAQLGNMMYMQGQSIDECELGRDIYHSQGEMELSDKQSKIIERMADGMKYVLRKALKDAVKHDD